MVHEKCAPLNFCPFCTHPSHTQWIIPNRPVIIATKFTGVGHFLGLLYRPIWRLRSKHWRVTQNVLLHGKYDWPIIVHVKSVIIVHLISCREWDWILVFMYCIDLIIMKYLLKWSIINWKWCSWSLSYMIKCINPSITIDIKGRFTALFRILNSHGGHAKNIMLTIETTALDKKIKILLLFQGQGV